ncbi:hypothetical protein EDC04DRAFT_1724274 [Pisolithus marmoratus]|nr:hypothetical protein EDC04DRAFT_1724274 [Pisolithus marmoratus]
MVCHFVWKACQPCFGTSILASFFGVRAQVQKEDTKHCSNMAVWHSSEALQLWCYPHPASNVFLKHMLCNLVHTHSLLVIVCCAYMGSIY